MKAIVTGATSGIGYACAEALISARYEVVGSGRKDGAPKGVTLIKAEFLNRVELESFGKKTLEALGGEVNVLVNCAGIGYFAPHEELSAAKLRDMVELNFLAPLEITRQLLRALKKNSGHIINIASITAKKASPQGAAYGATKAGLAHFGESLFEEARKSGVKVTTIFPDMTKTPFFDNLWFEPQDDEKCYLEAKCVADALMYALNARKESVISEIVIKPQKVGVKNKASN